MSRGLGDVYKRQMHERFGKGRVISIEGSGGDKKAEIKFEKNGIKKLLLRFSKLEIIS